MLQRCSGSARNQFPRIRAVLGMRAGAFASALGFAKDLKALDVIVRCGFDGELDVQLAVRARRIEQVGWRCGFQAVGALPNCGGEGVVSVIEQQRVDSQDLRGDGGRSGLAGSLVRGVLAGASAYSAQEQVSNGQL